MLLTKHAPETHQVTVDAEAPTGPTSRFAIKAQWPTDIVRLVIYNADAADFYVDVFDRDLDAAFDFWAIGPGAGGKLEVITSSRVITLGVGDPVTISGTAGAFYNGTAMVIAVDGNRLLLSTSYDAAHSLSGGRLTLVSSGAVPELSRVLPTLLGGNHMATYNDAVGTPFCNADPDRFSDKGAEHGRIQKLYLQVSASGLYSTSLTVRQPEEFPS